MLCIYNTKRILINTPPQPDGLSKVFIFFPWRGLHSHVTPYLFIFIFPHWCSSPHSVSPRDISQWAGRRGWGCWSAISLLPLTPPHVSCICMCVLAPVQPHNSLLRLLEDAVWEPSERCFPRGRPSTPHLPLTRALCLGAAHVTAIVPN